MSYFPSISNASHLKLHFSSGIIIFGKIKKQYSNITILPLPTKLVNYRNKNYFTACAVLLFSLGLSIYVQEYAPSLLGLLFTAFFLWNLHRRQTFILQRPLHCHFRGAKRRR